jgi:hypothetical protein
VKEGFIVPIYINGTSGSIKCTEYPERLTEYQLHPTTRALGLIFSGRMFHTVWSLIPFSGVDSRLNNGLRNPYLLFFYYYFFFPPPPPGAHFVFGALGSVVVKELCYKPEGHGFDNR